MTAPPAPGRAPTHASVEAAMLAAWQAGGELLAIASVDLFTGDVLSARTRGERSREQLDYAAVAASSVCSAPRLDAHEDATGNDALVVSDSAIHAFALAKGQPDRVVVGIAPGGANVALLVACVRRVADTPVD